MQPMIMPYRADGERESVAELVDSLRYIQRPGAIARKLALYSVPVPRNHCANLIAAKAARVVESAKFGEQFILLENNDIYSIEAGLDWSEPTLRTSIAF